MSGLVACSAAGFAVQTDTPVVSAHSAVAVVLDTIVTCSAGACCMPAADLDLETRADQHRPHRDRRSSALSVILMFCSCEEWVLAAVASAWVRA